MNIFFPHIFQTEANVDMFLMAFNLLIYCVKTCHILNLSLQLRVYTKTITLCVLISLSIYAWSESIPKQKCHIAFFTINIEK